MKEKAIAKRAIFKRYKETYKRRTTNRLKLFFMKIYKDSQENYLEKEMLEILAIIEP